MSETRPRFQFGLRKLLLWTAAFSLYCGAAEVVGVRPIMFAAVTGCVVLLGIVRIVFDSTAAVFVWAIAGTMLIVGWVDTFFLVWVCVLVLFLVLNGMSTAVDWADNLMASKTDEREE